MKSVHTDQPPRMQRVGGECISGTHLGPNYPIFLFISVMPPSKFTPKNWQQVCFLPLSMRWSSTAVQQVLPRWLSGKESACQCRRHRRRRFDPWVEKIPWRRPRQPTPVFLPGKSHGQRSLAGSSPWGRKESDRTELMGTYTRCATSYSKS